MNISSIDTGYLVDDLMEKGMIRDDINFGEIGFLDHQELEFVKGVSPSHESDSGMSSGSSPTYSTASGIEDEPVFTDLHAENLNGLEDFDEELSSYLEATSKIGQNSNDGYVYSPVLSTPSTSPIIHVDEFVSSTEGGDQFTISPVLSVPDVSEPVTRVHTRSSVKQLQQTLKSATTSETKRVASQTIDKKNVMNNKLQTKPGQTNVPQVKVIKVISTPANQSKNETEKRIFEAIDERNKKNAIQAKINREKKKNYIKGLEDEIDSLKEENSSLRDSKAKMEQTVNILEDEVAYLKNIIANQSALSNLLKNIPNVSNVKLSSSFSQRKRAASHDHDYQGPVKRSKTTTAGVCLHVNNDSASLEFCSKCSVMAEASSEKS